MSLANLWRLRVAATVLALAVAGLSLFLGMRGVWHPVFATFECACSVGLALVFMPLVGLSQLER